MTDTARIAQRELFLARFAHLFEHSPWVVERTFDSGSVGAGDAVDALHAAFCRTLREASDGERLALVRAHPDLAGRLAAAGRLTADSAKEQASAGLDRLTDEERRRFTELNDAYKARFDFPFIFAVKGRGKDEIRKAFEERISHDRESELNEALRQIEKIVWLRLSGDDPAVPATPGARLMQRLDALAQFTAEPGKLTRLYLTGEHKAAMEQVRAWMAEAGLATHVDGMATLVGRYESEPPGAPALLVGSHIDTVRDAGRYDGNLGVLAAVQAVDELHRQGRRLPFAIEVLAFGDEEGVRFPTTLSGSRAVAGVFDPATLDLADAEGISLREALLAFGCNPDPAAISAIARNGGRALGYVELHIEQGPVLQDAGLPIGVVTAINGATRFSIEVEGVAGHAGTVPMELRRDALAATCEMVLAIEREALGRDGLVATVGMLRPMPGAGNVIPGKVSFSLDIRSPRDDDRENAIAAIERKLSDIAVRRRAELRMTRTYDEPAIAADRSMRAALAAAVRRCGYRVLELPSGAGHDAMAIGGVMPMAMLFLRCRDGISHNPLESITVDDAQVAVDVLVEFLASFDPDVALP
ncbi:MAG: allantoate amidohydrolase [Geminicoccaceae bacterium]